MIKRRIVLRMRRGGGRPERLRSNDGSPEHNNYWRQLLELLYNIIISVCKWLPGYGVRRKLTKQSAVFAFVEFSFVIKKKTVGGVIKVFLFANNLVLIYTDANEKTTSNLSGPRHCWRQIYRFLLRTRSSVVYWSIGTGYASCGTSLVLLPIIPQLFTTVDLSMQQSSPVLCPVVLWT